MGVLQGAVVFHAQDPVINAIFMELALLFAPKGAELSAMHVWSENNTLADTLSRLAEGAEMPPLLTKLPRSDPCRDGFYILSNSVKSQLELGRVARRARPSGL